MGGSDLVEILREEIRAVLAKQATDRKPASAYRDWSGVRKSRHLRLMLKFRSTQVRAQPDQRLTLLKSGGP